MTNEQVLDPTSLLIKQDIKQAGFYEDGIIAASVTMAIILELEKQRETHLGEQITTDLERKDYERWSWEACIPMSAV